MLFLVVSVIALLIVIVLIACISSCSGKKSHNVDGSVKDTEGPELYIADQPDLDVQLLTVNEYSRPGKALEEVKGIVIHWTANPGTTAIQNRNYFENLKDGSGTKASSHFIVGIDGEIVQCIPCNEWAYASNSRNSDTIAIECCTPDDTGEFTGNTYDSVLHLVTWLMGRYDLTVDDVIRHYDITGKECPKYYIDEDRWAKFKRDLTNYIVLHGVEKTPSSEGLQSKK